MLNSLRNNWNALAIPQKAGLVAILVAVFGGILALGITSSRPTYGVLYSKLTMADAGAITNKLKGMNVNYKVINDGEIEVPAEQVHELRLSLAADGLPQQHGDLPGNEMLDKVTLGATQESQTTNNRRALEGELIRTIKSNEGIEDARVHLAMPAKSAFAEASEDVKASVKLTLREGYRLSPKQVEGLVHLVSTAVERLKPENITITDSKSNQLNSKGEGEMIDKDQIAMQERFERHIREELQQLADRTLGVNHAEITVRAELDWDQSQLSSEIYKPSGTDGANLPTTENKTDEKYTRADPKSPASPGTMTTAVANNNNSPGEYNKTQNTNAYVVNKTTEKRVMASGKPKKISVAVFLDEAANIPPAKQADLRNTLATAAGLDITQPASGSPRDQISLFVFPFDRSVEIKEKADATAAAKQETQLSLIRNGAALLTLILVAAFTLVMMRPRRPKRQKLDATLDGQANQALPGSAAAPELSGGPMSARTNGTLLEAGTRSTRNDIPLDQNELATPLGRIRRIAVNQPEDVSAMLQGWLRDQPIENR